MIDYTLLAVAIAFGVLAIKAALHSGRAVVSAWRTSKIESTIGWITRDDEPAKFNITLCLTVTAALMAIVGLALCGFFVAVAWGFRL